MILNREYLEFGVQPQQGANVQYNIIKRVYLPDDPSVVPNMANYGNLSCCIENQGKAAVTLTVEGSLDNNQTDAYSGHVLNFMLFGASVNTMTVASGGRAEFVLLNSVILPYPYLKFLTTYQSRGLIGIAIWTGSLEMRSYQGYP
jgi:hypothetical protein